MNRRRSLSTTKKPNNKQIFKKFLEFLESGVWTMPISMFTEQHSILFDREQGDPNTYDHLHKEFASLVDVLIESYCDDVGLTPRELVEALKSTDQSTKLSYRERILLEPVVAAQDFNVFVPMMMRKSIEMQLQALHMLTKLSGLLPSSLRLDDDDAEMYRILNEEDESERFILISVLKQSREEWEQDKKWREEMEKQFQTTLKASEAEMQFLEHQRQVEQHKVEEAMRQNSDYLQHLDFGSTNKVSSSSIGTNTEGKSSSSTNTETTRKASASIGTNTDAASFKASTAVGTEISSTGNSTETNAKEKSSNANGTERKFSIQADETSNETGTKKEDLSFLSSASTNNDKSSSTEKMASSKPKSPDFDILTLKPKSSKETRRSSTTKLESGTAKNSDESKPTSADGSSNARPPTSRPRSVSTKVPKQNEAKKVIDSKGMFGKDGIKEVKGQMPTTMVKPAPENGEGGNEVKTDSKRPMTAKKKNDTNSLLQEKEGIPEELLKQRAEYLRQQRDKLLEMKRVEREKQLQNLETANERPKTAKAARGALQGLRFGPTNEEVLEARRALASKLKTEVVEGSV